MLTIKQRDGAADEASKKEKEKKVVQTSLSLQIDRKRCEERDGGEGKVYRV